jgi:hypothetical protein
MQHDVWTPSPVRRVLTTLGGRDDPFATQEQSGREPGGGS